MAARSICQPGPDNPIIITPFAGRVIVRAGDLVLVDTDRALVLKEANTPPVYYLPHDDTRMASLLRSDTTRWCPYKGEASYFSIPALGDRGFDAVWTYLHPQDAVSAIAHHLAFDRDRVSIEVGAAAVPDAE
jgi:uncharacterized protein (DUF427 family)